MDEKNLIILSRSEKAFDNRQEGGKLLGAALGNYHGANAVVLGIPRGGVIIAREIARVIDGQVDMVVARKIGAPGNPELAIGAVSEDGRCFIDKRVAEWTGGSEEYIEQERQRQLAEIDRRIKVYREILPKVPLENRVAIITDDGVATGATMQAALWAARQEKPTKLIAAVPVGSKDSLERLAHHADEVIALRVPEYFDAVGRFYREFFQVEDEDLLAFLRELAKEKVPR